VPPPEQTGDRDLSPQRQRPFQAVTVNAFNSFRAVPKLPS
jgi:hypothetical protein